MGVVKKKRICWICGVPADTSEHKIKKTDVEIVFNESSYRERMIRKRSVGGGRYRIIQGSNSKELKYQKNLCKKCNGSKTQPFDKAYEQLIDHLMKNYSFLKRKRDFNLQLVYGKCKKKKLQQQMFKYFIKAFGCCLDSHDLRVPVELIAALNGHNYGSSLSVSLQFIVDTEGTVGYGSLMGAPLANNSYESYIWWYYVGPFCFTFAYGVKMPKEFGDAFYAKKKLWPVSLFVYGNSI